MIWTTSKPKPESAKKRETAMEFLGSTSAIIVIALFIMTFIFQNFEIPSSSMVKALLVGDHVLVDRTLLAPKDAWAPFVPYRDPRHGDIFVFFKPTEPGLHLVKRVIGVPGDRIHLKDGFLYRNGEKVDEPYVQRNGNYDAYRDNFPDAPASLSNVPLDAEWRYTLDSHVQNGDLVVPPGYYFAMGDNRDVSLDSRYWGFVPRENIVGRPLFVYWSFETPENQWEQTGLSDRVGIFSHTVLHFFDQTRWSRTLHLVN